MKGFFLKQPGHFSGGAATVTDLIFYFRRQFSHCFAKLREIKDRVIAKAVHTLRLQSYKARALSRANSHFPARRSHGNNAPETGGAFFPGETFHPGEQIVNPVPVRSAFTGITGRKPA